MTTLKQAAINYAQKVGSGLNYDVVKRSFKAGAEWQKKQFCERNYIKGFKAAVERMEVELQAMRKKYKDEDL